MAEQMSGAILAIAVLVLAAISQHRARLTPAMRLVRTRRRLRH